MRSETALWVDLAEGDYMTAIQLELVAQPSPSHICFIVPQCAERYLKALLEEASRPVPRIHDISRLVALTIDLVPALRPQAPDLEGLSAYAVDVRYGMAEVTMADAAEAVQIIRTMRPVIRAALGLSDVTP